ncbi:GNAT family N-acetyltransferase [Streptomyces sp. AB3(2024)]|uniref:GNAT family N-acetyltransferase n=1 Tax=Streptomyces sp. AB3(2024) TaxID=3317321 RepID=UPI0035A36958
MFAVVYRWRLHEGKEQQFKDGWRRVTAAIHARCGSYGSRLHRADDGTWVAYARWPDAESRERCEVPDPQGVAMMSGAIAERFPETRLLIVDDMLAEPPGPPVAESEGSAVMGDHLATARSWVEGWAVVRGASEPVDVPWGLRVEIGRPARTVRHVLLDADAATARGLIGTITEPGTCVKAFLPPGDMEPWFPSAWEPTDHCFLMAVDLRPSPVRAPDGYTVTVETADGVTLVRVLSADGEPAACGRTGLAGTACVFDQIVTEPAHRRLGLGTVVMAALTDAAIESGATTGILGATVQGRALYEALGWKVLSPLSGFVYRPPARSHRTRTVTPSPQR